MHTAYPKTFSLPIPLATRRAVLLRARNACEACGTDLPLTLHHLRYDKGPNEGWESICGKETPDDLVALCWSCHQAEHRDLFGTYYYNPDEAAGFREQQQRLIDKE
jgi:5-methylcytosine-specific restriction endonuclease McrA